jgi:hypothetical protein
MELCRGVGMMLDVLSSQHGDVLGAILDEMKALRSGVERLRYVVQPEEVKSGTGSSGTTISPVRRR